MNSRIDIQLIANFLIKLTAMPLQFFDSRMTGDIHWYNREKYLAR